MSSLPSDPVPLYDFNPGRKPWKIYAHKISSITDGNLILQADGTNSEIYFKQKNNEVYKISDLLSGGGSGNITINENRSIFSNTLDTGIGVDSHPGNLNTLHDGIRTQDFSNNVAFGTLSGNNRYQKSVAIGFGANYISNLTQGSDGSELGNNIAIGRQAGYINQDSQTVAIGQSAGQSNQKWKAVAVGAHSGNNQYEGSVALGANSGGGQREYSIAIGQQAGNNNLGEYSIAIGYFASYLNAYGGAGQTNDGSRQRDTIAIGKWAGCRSDPVYRPYYNQPSNSIVINSQSTSTTELDLCPTNSGFYVKPIRNVASTTGDKLCYDSGTGEISYQTDSGGGGGSMGSTCYFRVSHDGQYGFTVWEPMQTLVTSVHLNTVESAVGVTHNNAEMKIDTAGIYSLHGSITMGGGFTKLKLFLVKYNGASVSTLSDADQRYYTISTDAFDGNHQSPIETMSLYTFHVSYVGPLAANDYLALVWGEGLGNNPGVAYAPEKNGSYFEGFKIA
jgi:hypothetical protein